jgi:hypothetical protein
MVADDAVLFTVSLLEELVARVAIGEFAVVLSLATLTDRQSCGRGLSNPHEVVRPVELVASSWSQLMYAW